MRDQAAGLVEHEGVSGLAHANDRDHVQMNFRLISAIATPTAARFPATATVMNGSVPR